VYEGDRKRATEEDEMNVQTGVVQIQPAVEVVAKAERRRFTAEYKRRILREAAACSKPGEIGALLRREGLYTSHLSAWWQARERGEFAGLSPRRRGPQAKRADARDKRIAELEREDRRFKVRIKRAEAVFELQKKSPSCWGSSCRGTRTADANRR
jgi:transposase-like protein